MTVDDWPILCQHHSCSGTATPATWLLNDPIFGKVYYCQNHAQRRFNKGVQYPDRWVKLTPNQRPNQVQEAHNGND